MSYIVDQTECKRAQIESFQVRLTLAVDGAEHQSWEKHGQEAHCRHRSLVTSQSSPRRLPKNMSKRDDEGHERDYSLDEAFQRRVHWSLVAALCVAKSLTTPVWTLPDSHTTKRPAKAFKEYIALGGDQLLLVFRISYHT